MKRNLIYAALSLCLLLAGCDGAQEQPESTPASPSDLVVVEPAPAEESGSPVEAEPEVPEQPAEEQVPYAMTAGVWLAVTDAGYSNYYYFQPESRSGSYVSLEYGLGMPFTYDGSEEELVFRMEGHEENLTAAVEHVDGENFTLVWADSLPEKLSFVGEGTLEDYPFYSNAELGDLAIAHYAVHSGTPEEELEGMTNGTMTNVDNTVTIQLYQNLEDHNSTAAWYVVDRFTATGTDLTSGEEIDLLNCRMDETVEEPAEESEEEPAEEQLPELEPEIRYDVTEPEKVAALIDLFLNDPRTIESNGGENLVDWLTNSTHGFTVLYGDPYFSFQGEWIVGWYAKAVDAGSFCPITIQEHLLEDVLAICGAER